jgi:hypothetical protein
MRFHSLSVGRGNTYIENDGILTSCGKLMVKDLNKQTEIEKSHTLAIFDPIIYRIPQNTFYILNFSIFSVIVLYLQ